MGLSMPITKAKIKTHFQYHFWQYLLLAVLAVLLWNFLYTTTRYRVPDNRKLEFYAEGFQNAETEAAMKALLGAIQAEAMPEMEEMSHIFLTLDDTYGDVQLSVWAGAGQGDVYALSKERFLRMAQGGAMLNLQPFVDAGRLSVEGTPLAAGMAREEGAEKAELFGIPMDALTGLHRLGVPTQGAFLSVLASSGNTEEAILFLDYLLTHMREAQP